MGQGRGTVGMKVGNPDRLLLSIVGQSGVLGRFARNYIYHLSILGVLS